MGVVELVEVGPRDGLQNTERAHPPELRAELCRRAAASGIRRIEAVSFVRPDVVPQMAEPEAVVAGAAVCGAELCGLVLNLRGFDRLLDSGLARARFVPVISDTFSRRNGGMRAADALAVGEAALERALGVGVPAGVVLGTAFGCPFEGPIDPGRVLDAAERMAAAGATEVVFADTVGVAVPGQVRELVGIAASRLGVPVGVHLHDTRGTGYANAFAALEAGATIFDVSAGGLGGCPFAPQASGNIATEDLVWMLERQGVDTGVDLDQAIATGRWLCAATGEPTTSAQARVDRYPPTARTDDRRAGQPAA